MENIKKYQHVFQEIFNAKEEELGADFTAMHVSRWDSVTQMALVTALETAFDIMFDTDDILEFDSYEKGKEILTRYDVVL